MALPQLFSIGEMAKIFHLSVSSLRHYEALGLVTPEYVDPSTNYRYYSVRQFEPLNTIRYLRAMDMPLTEIADFLQNRDVETIEEKLRAQKAAVVQKQKELKRIERKLDATEDRIAAVLSRPMTAAIMAGLMSADVLKASYASLDDVPVADIWKNYLAQAGELSRAGLGKIDEVKLHARERADG